MLKKTGLFICTMAVVMFIGCSGFDSNQILVHPEQVKPSETFTVTMLNLYTYLNSDTVPMSDVTRDSLHLLVGLPGGWSAANAVMMIPDDMSATEMLALQNDLDDQETINTLANRYLDKAVPLPADGTLKLPGDSEKAHAVNSDGEMIVTTTSADQWKGFSSSIGITIKKGSKPDTILNIDSVTAMAAEAGAVDESQLASISTMKNMVSDKVGISIVPVVIKLDITAGTVEGTDTLFYFSKTGKMDQPGSPIAPLLQNPDDRALLSDLESGDMSYVPLIVSSTSEVGGKRVEKRIREKVILSKNADGSFTFNLNDAQQKNITLLSLQGKVVAEISNNGSKAVWNGYDRKGMKMPSGTYIAAIKGGNDLESVSLQLIR